MAPVRPTNPHDMSFWLVPHQPGPHALPDAWGSVLWLRGTKRWGASAVSTLRAWRRSPRHCGGVLASAGCCREPQGQPVPKDGHTASSIAKPSACWASAPSQGSTVLYSLCISPSPDSGAIYFSCHGKAGHTFSIKGGIVGAGWWISVVLPGPCNK